MKLNFFVKGQQLSLVDTPEILSGSINYLCAKFIFRSADWEDVNTKWAHFRRGDEVYDMRLDANDCIPQSAGLSLPSGTWEVYLHGDRTTTGSVFKRITTGVCTIEIKPCGSLDGDPMPPVAPSATEQIEAIAIDAKSIAQSVRDDADNGAFIGKQGPVGPQGPIGPIGPQGPKGERGDEVVVELPGAGATMVMNNSADAQLRNLRVFGKSKQFTTTGKNLLPYPYAYVPTDINGLTIVVNDDGSITIKGTATETVTMNLADDTNNANDALGRIEGSFVLQDCAVRILREDGTYYYNNSSYTLPKGDKIVYAYLQIQKGATVDKTYYPMINEGTTALPYEPYTGGKASPNPNYPQAIESVENPVVKLNSKNLLNLPVQTVTHNGVTYTVNSDGSVVANGTATADSRIYHIIELEPNVEYVLTGSLVESNNTSHGLIVIDCEDYEEVWASYGGTATHFTPKNHTRFEVRVKVTNGFTANNLVFYPMVRYAGVGDNTFEPYTEQTLTLPYALRGLPVSEGGNFTDENGQQWVCDTVDYERGVLIQRIYRYDFTGNETLVTYDNNTLVGGRTTAWGIPSCKVPTPSSASNLSPIASNVGQVSTQANLNSGANHGIAVSEWNAGSANIYFDIATYGGIDEFKASTTEAYANGMPWYIVYAMATPIETPLTEEELEAYAALRTVYPTTVVTNDHAAYMEASFVADPEILIRNLAVNDEKQRVVLKQTQVDLNERIKKFYTNNLGETHVTDSDDGYMRHTVLSGKSEQLSTTGKNLLPNKAVSTTKNGVTITVNEDKSITFKGTAENTFNICMDETYDLDVGEYVLSGCPAGGNDDSYLLQIITAITGGTSIAIDRGTGMNFTLSDKLEDVVVRVVVIKGTVMKHTFYPMIRRADAGDDSYEPYTGGVVSPNPSYPQEIKSVENVGVKVTGAQLFNVTAPISAVTNAKHELVDGTLKVTSTRNGGGTNYFWVRWDYDVSALANIENLTVSCEKMTALGSTTPLVCLRTFNAEGVQVASAEVRTAGEFKTVSLAGIQSVRLIAYATSGTAVTIGEGATYEGIMLNAGTEALPYEPYTEQAITIPHILRGLPVETGGNYADKNGQQWVCDEVDVERGVLVQRVKSFALDNTLAWGRTSTKNGKWYFYTRFNDGVKQDYAAHMSTIGVCATTAYGESIGTDYRYGESVGKPQIGVFTNATELATLDEFLVWLVENPITALIQLAEPIEIPLSAEEIEAYKALQTHYGGTNILFDSTNGVVPFVDFDYPCALDSFVEYVKAQTGDTREFVYNMEQRITDDEYLTALAYVNSEYASALLELEV